MPVRACAANQLLHRLVEKSPVLRNFLLQIVECGRSDGVRSQVELDEFGVEAPKNISHRLYTQNCPAAGVGKNIEHDAVPGAHLDDIAYFWS